MKEVYVKDLSKGMTLDGETFAVKELNKLETKNGKPYYKVSLIDKTGDITGQIWSDNIPNVEKGSLTPGNVVIIDAIVEEYRGAAQLNISRVNKVDETALDEFIEASDFDLDELWGMLEEHITSVEDSEIKDFLVSIFADKEIAAKYKTRPAAEYVHHSFHGGLLEHVVEMLELAKSMRMFYKEVNYDYVIAGIILHDIGKLFELDIEGTVVQRTTEGYLIGHLVKSYEFLYEHGKDKLSDEHILNLKHIILSHHGVLEYGSPVVPATIEASMVNAVDEASTKVRIFQKILRKNENSSELFAPWDNILKTRVYRGPGALKSDDGQIMF